jgi:hypothetical protein
MHVSWGNMQKYNYTETISTACMSNSNVDQWKRSKHSKLKSLTNPQLSIGTKLLTTTRKIPKNVLPNSVMIWLCKQAKDGHTCFGEALWSVEVEWMTILYQFKGQQPSFLIMHNTHPMEHLLWLQSANRTWRGKGRTLGVYWMATLHELSCIDNTSHKYILHGEGHSYHHYLHASALLHVNSSDTWNVLLVHYSE